MKCNSCGIESPVEAAFRPAGDLFQRSMRYCPPCADKRDWHDLKTALIFLAAIAALSLFAGFGLEGPGPKRNELLLFPLCFLVLPLNIIVHEIAHAVTAWAMGLRVFSVWIGCRGPVLWQSEKSGIEMRVTWAPLDGLTLVAPRSLERYRLRFLATVAAGPLINGLMATASYLLSGTSPTMSLWTSVVFWSNTFLVAITLFPWRYRTPRGIVPSDGLALLTVPFAPQERLRERHAAYFALEGLACLKKRDFRAAIDWAERGLREHPREISNRSILGIGQLGLDQFDVARQTFESCLADSEKNLVNKAIFLMHLAWIELGRDDRGNLEAANRATEEALALTPWVPAIQGTRGCALVDLEKLDEGIDLLRKALKDRENQDKSTFASYLALAFAKKGLSDESHKLIEEARRFKPNCPVLARTEKEISSAAVV
jgi:tetratricopeptide (TPR) repeat protein